MDPDQTASFGPGSPEKANAYNCKIPKQRELSWADPEEGGTRGQGTPEKSQKYRVSLQYWS